MAIRSFPTPQRRYIDAVELALKARQAFPESTEDQGELQALIDTVLLFVFVFISQVQTKIDELVNLLIDELKSNTITHADSRRYVRLLVSLGERDIAQYLFLNHVHNEIDVF